VDKTEKKKKKKERGKEMILLVKILPSLYGYAYC